MLQGILSDASDRETNCTGRPIHKRDVSRSVCVHGTRLWHEESCDLGRSDSRCVEQSTILETMEARKYSLEQLKKELTMAYVRGRIIHLTIDARDIFNRPAECISLVFPSIITDNTLSVLKQYIETTFNVVEITLSFEHKTMRIVAHK